jgi:hypothetical protein
MTAGPFHALTANISRIILAGNLEVRDRSPAIPLMPRRGGTVIHACNSHEPARHNESIPA